MFKRLTDQQRDTIEQADSFSPNMLKIKALFQAYGTQYDFVRFYANDSKNAIVSIQDNCATLYCKDDSDLEEACEFISMLSNEVLSEQPLRLAGYQEEIGNIYVCHRFEDVTLDPLSHEIQDAYQVLSQVFSNDINDKNYPRWYTEISHRVRHGVSKVYTYQNLCSATAYCNIDGQLFITQLATVEHARGQGLAKKLLYHIATHEKNVNRIVLLSQNKVSDQFYQNIGFTFLKHWYFYNREENKQYLSNCVYPYKLPQSRTARHAPNRKMLSIYL
ncbi:GNAT family N-acetyltransferase [Paludicola sp. MB14-C6]|uniref:GNAT family N-acetyltransferase n=1 Tax=Paludihabitans sp. MB14-C6 TaxID=3070656 RepID=UPI0027DE2ECD|nr:GNAT family N-acetyltransferase [Paludicola sp. MB14-C6]WMJ23877.1 GNAT family N-acetyltransferase [Paludicola sp. MB14-C6]